LTSSTGNWNAVLETQHWKLEHSTGTGTHNWNCHWNAELGHCTGNWNAALETGTQHWNAALDTGTQHGNWNWNT